MAYTIGWLQDKRVISVRFWGDTTVEELESMFDALIDHMNQGVKPVHTITDITELRKFPLSIAAIKNTMPRMSHPKMGWNVVVGGPVLIQSFSQIITRVANIRYRSFQTMDEATEFLSVEDHTLETS